LIVVGEVREPKPNMMVQEAIKRAMEERGAKAIVLTTWELLGISEKDFLEIRDALKQFTISDGQRELEYFFTVTGLMRKPEQGRDWVRKNDAHLYTATWPRPHTPAPPTGATRPTRPRLAVEPNNAPGVGGFAGRRGARPNPRKLLEHH